MIRLGVKKMVWLPLLLATLMWGGCTPIPTQEGVAAPTTEGKNIQRPLTASTLTPGAKPVASATLSLNIAEPENESVSEAKELPVKGTASGAAVVSVNGRIVATDAAGGFSTTVSLIQGANSIEIIASDKEGNEVRQIQVVFYLP